MLQKVKKSAEKIKNLSDRELAGLTDTFRKRYQDGESLDALLPEAFAAIMEADARILENAPMMCRCLQALQCIRGIWQK